MEQSTLVYRVWALLSLLFVLSGCRYKTWGESVFNQGCKLDKYQEATCEYLRTVHVYDQFTTLGHFEILWLSNEVRRVYSKLYAQQHCYNDERYKIFLRRQLEENNHYITFYVLAALPHSRGTLLSEETSEWSLCLEVDGYSYPPHTIKTIELKPEYKHLFSRAYTHFKTPYIVTFEARDIEGSPLIHSAGQTLRLHFNRIGRTEYAEWQLRSDGSVCIAPEDVPDFLMYDLWKY